MLDKTSGTALTGNVTVTAGGTLDFGANSQTTAWTNLTLGDGSTLLLNNTTQTIANLTITGDTVLDFAGGGSTLNVGTLTIADDATLSIINWSNASDLFIANNDPGTPVLGDVVDQRFAGRDVEHRWRCHHPNAGRARAVGLRRRAAGCQSALFRLAPAGGPQGKTAPPEGAGPDRAGTARLAAGIYSGAAGLDLAAELGFRHGHESDRLHAHGGPEVLKLEEIPEPVPSSGEVLVRVAVAGLNFLDTYQRAGLYPVDAAACSRIGRRRRGGQGRGRVQGGPAGAVGHASRAPTRSMSPCRR
ncbi:MAG: hypothetical protein WDM96_14850 [Lacunisphaera sp.]